MVSKINPNNIDGTYPVAGQDNDSQGFRTNFSNIRNNFTNTKAEIEDLQAKVILKSELDGSPLNNNMAGTLITSPTILDMREVAVSYTSQTEITLDPTITTNYAVNVGNNVVFSIANNFTSGDNISVATKLFIELNIQDIAYTVTFPTQVSYGTDHIYGLVDVVNGTETNRELRFKETGIYHFELWTKDGGASFNLVDKTRARKIKEYTPTAIGQPGDTAGEMYFDSGFIYVCVADYDGSTQIWRKATLANIGA